MSVISPARALPAEIHLHQLPEHIHTQFDQLMDRADQHAERHELSASALLHTQAAQLIGIRLPDSGELTRCTCQGCYCTCAFDAAQARTYLDGTIEFVQCPGCADDHPRTEDD
ncbi:hypothetical protein [Streptomyces sp. NPDC005407]|uniref:hypothetical protein n=1 Tax=Streptomyces sp. NPDC005407 TaxID=3155340 RepID=UPI0033AC564A